MLKATGLKNLLSTNKEVYFKTGNMEVTGDFDKKVQWKRRLKGRVELVDK